MTCSWSTIQFLFIQSNQKEDHSLAELISKGWLIDLDYFRNSFWSKILNQFRSIPSHPRYAIKSTETGSCSTCKLIAKPSPGWRVGDWNWRCQDLVSCYQTWSKHIGSNLHIQNHVYSALRSPNKYLKRASNSISCSHGLRHSPGGKIEQIDSR